MAYPAADEAAQEKRRGSAYSRKRLRTVRKKYPTNSAGSAWRSRNAKTIHVYEGKVIKIE
jgi:hypothetical protein